ncbi:hypothetical protein, partial [Phocaeicola abscessus]|uniref:hypothetical protein n=1 Tax=Phocaeicola abscessus TaxID=555313 RepID=UPI0028EC5A6E
APTCGRFDRFPNGIAPTCDRFDRFLNGIAPTCGRFDRFPNGIAPTCARFDRSLNGFLSAKSEKEMRIPCKKKNKVTQTLGIIVLFPLFCAPEPTDASTCSRMAR